jgi:hypothetical protein
VGFGGVLHIVGYSGSILERTLPEPPTVQQLQLAVGGHIELVLVIYGQMRQGFVNEDRDRLQLPINELATKFFWAFNFPSLNIPAAPRTPIRGNMAIWVPEVLEEREG